MSGNIVRSLDQHSKGYCSQLRGPLPDIKNIDEGIKVIEEILNRTVLCRHDVKEINKVYRLIDHFERLKGRQIELGSAIPKEFTTLQMNVLTKLEEQSSEEVLGKVITKIQKIATDKNIAGLISLFHLQSFSDKDLRIEDHFNSLWNFTKNKEMIKHIATCLPCCSSERDFNEDISALIGPDPDKEAADILVRKKKLQQIGIRKLQLAALREEGPERYPKYLEELLDNGYIHLFDHLIKVISDPLKCEVIIKEMSCSELAFVVLEIKDAIIKKVEKSTPDSSKALLLLGNKKVGKSTTFCFLKGDDMKQVCEEYKSESDQDQLIGDGKRPFALLPNIEVTDYGVIIDFPAFDHDHGEIISLGIECALKALIKKYDCRCLVLDSILEQSRFDLTGKLATRLERIMNNKSHCVLGITKYAQDPHFKQIRRIEEEKKDERQQPLEEESKLIGRIKRIPSVVKRKELEAQLEKMQKERLEKPLPETEKDRKELEKKENQLLKETQLATKIKLDNLSESSLALSYCKTLFAAEPISVKPHQLLDPYIEQLFTHDFKQKLKKELETRKDYHVNYGNFKDFEQKMRETSLINAFLCESNPEIGAFLHLEEIDPKIVRDFDQTIADSCMEKCIKTVMCQVNISLIKKILNEVKSDLPIDLYKNLEKFSDTFTCYLLDLQEIPYEDLMEAEEEYERIRNQYIAAQEEVEKDYQYPTWANVLFGFVLGIPIGINVIMKWMAQKAVKRTKIIEYVNSVYKEMNQKYELLMNLKKIQILTKKNSEVENAMKSEGILANSMEDLHKSLKIKFRKVRAAYGITDWKARISFIANGFSFPSYDPNKKSHFFCLLAASHLLIEPGSSIKIEKIGSLQKEDAVIENGKIIIRAKSFPDLQSFNELRKEKIALNRLMSAAALLQFHKNALKK